MSSEKEFDDYFNNENKAGLPLTIMCTREPDDESAEIIDQYMQLIKVTNEDEDGKKAFEHIMHHCLKVAIYKSNASHSVVKSLVKHGAPWQVEGEFSMVGRAVRSTRNGGDPELLQFLLEVNAPIDSICRSEMNPLIRCIRWAIITTKTATLEQVLMNEYYQSMCLLLDHGCYVNEIDCPYNSKIFSNVFNPLRY